MTQPTQPPRCAVCTWPLDPETDDAHWIHEPDCPGADGRPNQACQCDLYVHPQCCPWCRADDASGLVDVTMAGRDAGWTWRVSVTRGVWERYVARPTADGLQTTNERLWNVVWMARGAVLRSRNGAARRVPFAVYAMGRDRTIWAEELYVDIGPNDSGEPVITIMLVSEHESHPSTEPPADGPARADLGG